MLRAFGATPVSPTFGGFVLAAPPSLYAAAVACSACWGLAGRWSHGYADPPAVISAACLPGTRCAPAVHPLSHVANGGCCCPLPYRVRLRSNHRGPGWRKLEQVELAKSLGELSKQLQRGRRENHQKESSLVVSLRMSLDSFQGADADPPASSFTGTFYTCPHTATHSRQVGCYLQQTLSACSPYYALTRRRRGVSACLPAVHTLPVGYRTHRATQATRTAKRMQSHPWATLLLAKKRSC